MSWQRTNIQSAVTYLLEQIRSSGGAGGPGSHGSNVRVKAIYEGLLDVLEPARRTVRLQREAADTAKKASAPVPVTRERRQRVERRGHSDRRLVNLGAPAGIERRRKSERRGGDDRRNR